MLNLIAAKCHREFRLALLLLGIFVANSAPSPTLAQASESGQFLVAHCGIGRTGGRLVISQRSEPKTLNPVIAIDSNSREILSLINADLIHINRATLKTESALASSWTVSADSRVYTLKLRAGLKFSDGEPFNADDVLFSFQVYLDERCHSPQRDLLIVSGTPIRLQKIDNYTVRFELKQPYAAAERIFDGLAILPRHLLSQAYEENRMAESWNLSTPPRQIAGLGAFRLKEYIPGQRVVLERNPYYWKKDLQGNRLPYLDEIVTVFTGNADAEAMRFQQGNIDVIERLSATTYSVLEKYQQTGAFRLYDLGPGLEYDFLVFNLNDLASKDLSSVAAKQAWFRNIAFRRAASAAIDRQAIVRLAYRGRASPLSTNVTPGNKLWFDPNIPQPVPSASRAREILRAAGFSWDAGGHLLDERHMPVSFSIVFNAANPQHSAAATLLQQDLAGIGLNVTLAPLEYHALLNRVFETFDYNVALMAFVSGDADPNSEINVLSSPGGGRPWNLASKRPQTPWEQTLDRLMQQQMITPDYEKRREIYARVQRLFWENLPFVCLISPDVLVGAKEQLGNFHPAILSDYALWNAEELFLRH